MRFKRVFMAIGLFFVLISSSFSLEPKLLWKKELKDKVWDFDYARITGDIIFISGEVVTLINKDGKIVWQWGPDPKRSPGCVSISDNGKYIAFGTRRKEDFELEVGYEEYIHYCERSGKEIWRIQDFSPFWLSPDGKYLFVGSLAGWEGPSYLLDSKRKILWKKDIGITEQVVFSPDGNYCAVYTYEVFLLDIQKKDIISRLPCLEITSISENGEYIGLEKDQRRGVPQKGEDGIYDKKGNLIFKGKNIISGNGRVVVQDAGEKIDIFNFPQKTKIISYPIKRVGGISISYDGRIVVVCGKRTDRESASNLFILDILEKTLWEGYIEPKGAWVLLSRDGKYLSVVQGTSIYYFQIF